MGRHPELTGNPLPGVAIAAVLSVFIIFGVNRCTSNKRSNVSESGYEWTTDSTYPCILPLPKGFTLVQNPYTKKYAIYTGVGKPYIPTCDYNPLNLGDLKSDLYLGDVQCGYDGEGSNIIQASAVIRQAKIFNDSCSAKNYYATYVHKLKHEKRLSDSVRKVEYDDSIALLFTLPKDTTTPKDTTGKIKVTPFDNGDIKKTKRKAKHHKHTDEGWPHITIDGGRMWKWGGDDSTNQNVVVDLTLPDVNLIIDRDSSYYWFSLQQYHVLHDFPSYFFLFDGSTEDMSRHYCFFHGQEYTECTSTNTPNPNFPDAVLIGQGLGFDGITTKDY